MSLITEHLKERITTLPAGRRVPWILDVDGALNADDRTPMPAYDEDWPTFRRTGVQASSGLVFPFVWAPDLVECINLLNQYKQVQVYWLSTWGSDAPDCVAPQLGLNVGNTLAGHMPFRERDGWWKILAVTAFATANPGPFFWTDDEIDDKVGTGVIHAMTGRNCLALCPDGRLGLSPEHLNLMVNTLERWRSDPNSPLLWEDAREDDS